VPTRTGIATAVSALLSVIAGRVFGIFELYVIAAAMFALVLCATIWVVANWRSVNVSREVTPRRLHAGGSSTVTLNLSNHRLVPTPVAQITDEVDGTVRADANVPPIGRNRKARASYRLTTDTRGEIEIGPMRTRVTDPFGLAASSRTSAPDATVLVLPRIDAIAAPPQPGGNLAQKADRTPNRVGAHGDEFSSLRAYVIGDDLRKVHWPSSARTGDLVVRLEDVPEHGHSLVLLDVRSTSADPETFEEMVSATASLVVACRDRGDRVRLVTTSGVDESADTTAEADQLLDFLALVQQHEGSSVSLPFRVGEAGFETGAMVVANNADTLIRAVVKGGQPSATSIVQFRPEGARPQAASGGLRSVRVIDVQPGDTFAAAWTRTIGR